MFGFSSRADHERVRLDRGQRDRLRWDIDRKQPVRNVLVAPNGVDHAVRSHDLGGHWRQPHRHMDRDDQQTDAERDQLLPGEPVHRRHYGVNVERHRQFQLHADQQLVVRHGLLQNQSIRGRVVYLRQRVHADGHLDRQVGGELIFRSGTIRRFVAR